MWKACRDVLFGCMIAALLAGEAAAQNYPVKAVRVIDGYPPGGGTDIVARMIALKFQERLGQPLVVDNRPGAQGIIGAEIAAISPPDGYTLLMFVTNYAIHPSLYKKLPYDLMKSFTAVTQTSTVAMVLAVSAGLSAKTVKEFIAIGKSNPRGLNFSSGGAGGITHMAGELFKSMTGAPLTHVGYKGGAPAVMAAATGEVDLTFAALPVGKPYFASGRLRPLAVTTAKRSVIVPELPTLHEAGVPGYDVSIAYGVLAPVQSPKAVVAKLHQEIARILALPDIRERLLDLGAEPVDSSPEQFAQYIRKEIAKWAAVVQSTGMETQTW